MSKEKTCKNCSIIFIPRNGNCLYCLDCKKTSNKCPHGTKKGRCKIDGCFGSEICAHKQHKQKCIICKPGMMNADKLNRCIISFIEKKKIREDTIKYILEYTSAESLDILQEYFQKNLEEINEKYGITHKECHLDHIKPKNKFNLKNKEELLECCKYTNLQFIPISENLKKGSKWSE